MIPQNAVPAAFLVFDCHLHAASVGAQELRSLPLFCTCHDCTRRISHTMLFLQLAVRLIFERQLRCSCLFLFFACASCSSPFSFLSHAVLPPGIPLGPW